MKSTKRTIVLVHGLWNNPQLFDKLIDKINQDDYELLIPFLPHKFGKTSLENLAKDLDCQIKTMIDPGIEIDLVGFSMGGLISRVWLQHYNGFSRTKRFFSIGTPHNGSYTAQLIPSWLFKGIAEMKKGSYLLTKLNDDLSALEKVECMSFYTKWDLMSFPGWHSKLSVGNSQQLPVLTHKELITNPTSLDVLAERIFINLN